MRPAKTKAGISPVPFETLVGRDARKENTMKPTENAVNDVLNQCAEQAEEGGSRWPGMTYEQGVEAAIRWMQGDGDNPVDD